MRWLPLSCLLFLVVLAGCLARSSTSSPQTVAKAVPACEPAPIDKPGDEPGATCVIYPLRDFGEDAQLVSWIAKTIPQVIDPKSWQEVGGIGTLSYHARGRVLVVRQTPGTQRQISEFLDTLKRSLPADRSAARTAFAGGVIPAQFVEPTPSAPSPRGPASYPVPAPAQQPKHLFHFLIRYEGDGIIDANVMEFAKYMQESNNGGASPTPPQTASQGVAPALVAPSASAPSTCPVAPSSPWHGQAPSTGTLTPCPPITPPTDAPKAPAVKTRPRPVVSQPTQDTPATRQHLEQLIRGMTGVPVAELQDALLGAASTSGAATGTGSPKTAEKSAPPAAQ
jgi:hypothetical protein